MSSNMEKRKSYSQQACEEIESDCNGVSNVSVLLDNSANDTFSSKMLQREQASTTNRRRQNLLMRRYMVAFLGFLCSFVMHSHRLNISFAIVAMVNSTGMQSSDLSSNLTECKEDIKNVTYSTKQHTGEFSWDPELQGYILSAGFLGYFLTQIPGGILAGKFGTKPVLMTGMMVASICNLLSPVSARQHAYLLIAVQLLRGMGQGLQQPALSVLMSKWFPRSERGFLSSFIYCGYPVGAFFTSLSSGAMCDLQFMGGWPLVFYVFGLIGLLVCLIFQISFAEKPTDDPKISEVELQYILSQQEGATSKERPATPWLKIVTSVPTYALIAGLFGQYWKAFYFLSVHPVYMGHILHIPIKDSGILGSGPHLLQGIAGWAACYISFWISRNRSVKGNIMRKGWNSLSAVIFSAGLIGVYLSGCDEIWNEVCLFIATGSVGFGFAGSLITAVDMSPTFCGPLMGFASTVGSIAGFLVPVTVGSLTKYEQSLFQWQKMFLISAAVGLGSGIIFLLFGSSNIEPYDPAEQKDGNVKSFAKQADKCAASTDKEISSKL